MSEAQISPAHHDNSVAILLTYGTVRVLLARVAEAREEEHMANCYYTRP